MCARISLLEEQPDVEQHRKRRLPTARRAHTASTREQLLARDGADPRRRLRSRQQRKRSGLPHCQSVSGPDDLRIHSIPPGCFWIPGQLRDPREWKRECWLVGPKSCPWLDTAQHSCIRRRPCADNYHRRQCRRWICRRSDDTIRRSIQSSISSSDC